MALNKNDIIPLTVQSISNDGSGVARFGDKIIFVSGAAVGDVLEARILKDKKTHAFAKIESIVQAGAARRKPPCPTAQWCGGCDFQHINYTAQLEAKQDFVQSAITRLAKLEIKALPIIPSEDEFRYRNKVQFPVMQDGEQLLYGFYAKRSHRIVPCEDCLLQPTLLNEIAAYTAQYLSENEIVAYDEERHTGLLRHIFLRQSSKTGGVMLCLVLTKNTFPPADLFVSTALERFPQIETIVININPEKTNIVCGRKNIVLHGKGYLEESFCGVPIEISPLSFAQVNSKTAEKLFDIAKSFANPTKNDNLLDLYCGAGIIGLSMAAECGKVIGVEIEPASVDAAKKAAAKIHLDNAEFICDDVGNAMQTLQKRGLTPSIITVDPPRKGCSPQTLDIISKMRPKRVVMVSCNPATAARDILALVQSGYTVQKIQPLDMFPNTKHVEMVALLELV